MEEAVRGWRLAVSQIAPMLEMGCFVGLVSDVIGRSTSSQSAGYPSGRLSRARHVCRGRWSPFGFLPTANR
jgi:hypothetical protein